MKIKLTRGKSAIVDDDLYEILNQFKWYAQKDLNTFYARRNSKIGNKRTFILMHHMVVGFPLNRKNIDHLNGDGLDNRRVNLRIVPHRENMGNTKDRREHKTTSKYVGIIFDKKRKMWRSSIKIGEKYIYIGHFNNEEKASESYKNAFDLIEKNSC